MIFRGGVEGGSTLLFALLLLLWWKTEGRHCHGHVTMKRGRRQHGQTLHWIPMGCIEGLLLLLGRGIDSRQVETVRAAIGAIL